MKRIQTVSESARLRFCMHQTLQSDVFGSIDIVSRGLLRVTLRLEYNAWRLLSPLLRRQSAAIFLVSWDGWKQN